VNDAPPAYRIRRADAQDVEQIMALVDEAISWLANVGLDQWQRGRRRQRDHLDTDVAEGTVFVVEREDRVVATITVDRFADTDFWRKKDRPRNALYVHRMAVLRAEAGIGLGAAMLDWAAGQVQRCGRTWLRLDAWRTNGRLHVYYKDLGFEKVRTEIVEGRGSGALFARPASYRHGGGPELVDLVTYPAPADGLRTAPVVH
jgi:GNAT superfamily N-acetyltransferase